MPENTVEGFRSALAAGAEAVEFDVRLTADGVPVVVHDADVSRTTDGEGLVHELALADIRRLQVRGENAEMQVPTLAEALVAVAEADGGADIEIKNVPGDPAYEADRESVLEATLVELERTGFAGPVVISSFNPDTLQRCHELAPEVPTGLLSIDAVPPSDTLEVAEHDGHAFILPSVRALLGGVGVVAEAHANSVRVGAWNADDPATVRRLLALGVDAVATNDPTMAHAVRTAWLREGGAGERAR